MIPFAQRQGEESGKMHMLPPGDAMACKSANLNLSFAGCGFLGLYHIGVASCFREYAPHVLIQKIAGASAGALAACALICNVPLGQSTSDVLRVAVKARSRALGPFHPGFDINKVLYDGLCKMLPNDSHLRCNGRLHVSVTRVSDGENVLLTQFDNKEDLIQALLCSCFIPFYSGIIPPKFHGVAYMDGGFSDNLPVLDDDTVTVSPFAGESDICPRDSSFNMLQMNLANTSIALSVENVFRFAHTLFPPNPEVLTTMCQQGFDDALKFLQRYNLISCTRCLAVQTRFIVAESESLTESESNSLDSDLDHSYDDCIDCRYRRQMALLDSLPEAVVKAIQEACDQMNKGVINWLFRHRPMKLLSILTIPYVLPVDITIVIFCKIWQLMPKVQKDIQKRLYSILALAKSLINRFNKKRHQYSAKFSCQLALTEFNYTAEDNANAYSPPIPIGYRSNAGHHLFSSGRSKSLEEVCIKATDRHAQRKSYAGQPSYHLRRASLVDTKGPERIIRSMNFGFTVNLSPMVATARNERHNVMTAFQTIGEENSELNAIEISNRALNWEREYLGRYHSDLEPQNADTFERILDVTSKQDSLMAFYYMDDNNHVNVTEIFNVTEADTSAILPEDEREVNRNLSWDSDWGTDAGSDQGSVTSGDSVINIPENHHSPLNSRMRFNEDLGKDVPWSEPGGSFDDFCLSLKSQTGDAPPQRKSSFIVVNE